MPDSFSGPQLILLGLSILAVGYLLKRSFARGKQSRRRDPAAEARQEMWTAEQSAASSIRRLEVRLHDYGREIEGRVETTLALLDRLIAEAERESNRLERLLEESRRSEATNRVAGVDQREPPASAPSGGCAPKTPLRPQAPGDSNESTRADAA